MEKEYKFDKLFKDRILVALWIKSDCTQSVKELKWCNAKDIVGLSAIKDYQNILDNIYSRIRRLIFYSYVEKKINIEKGKGSRVNYKLTKGGLKKIFDRGLYKLEMPQHAKMLISRTIDQDVESAKKWGVELPLP